MIPHFYSLKEELHKVLSKYISDTKTHARWLNTLSYLENCGARKIARTEHPLNVSKEVLKHAAEEFRHAFYLKQQISTKLGAYLPTYQMDLLWGGLETLRYLDKLELQICRILRSQTQNRHSLRYHAYLLVTFAIELRAAELYPIYQELLIQAKSPVSVRSILLDEKGHLEEMQKELRKLSVKDSLIDAVCAIEGQLCQCWLQNL